MSDAHAHARALNLLKDNGHDEIEARYILKRFIDMGFAWRSPEQRRAAHATAATAPRPVASELTEELNANLNASKETAKAMIRQATAKAKADYDNSLQEAMEQRDRDEAERRVAEEAARARKVAVAAALARIDAETKRAEACAPCNPIPPHPQAEPGCPTGDAPPLVLFSHAS